MNLTHLKYALEVARTGSITKAAETLYMGQPNLSKAIKELESLLHIQLFKRMPGGVVPTKAGEEFLVYARNILEQVDRMEALYKPHREDHLRFSACIPRASYVAYAFTNFVRSLDMSQEITLQFHETSTSEAINKVVEGEYGLAIIRYNQQMKPYYMKLFKEKGLRYELLWAYEYVVLMYEHHHLAAQQVITPRDLRDCIEIAHDDALQDDQQSQPYRYERADAPYKRIYVCERGSQMDLLNRVEQTFMWVSPLPQPMLESRGLVQRRCEPAGGLMNDVVITQRGHVLTDLEQQFLAEVNAVKGTLIEG